MAPHSNTLAWKISWTVEPGRLRSMGSLRVRHDWATSLSLFTFMHWRRRWQPTPVFLPGESQDGGAWWAAVCGVAQSRTRLKRLSSSSSSSSSCLISRGISHFVALCGHCVFTNGRLGQPCTEPVVYWRRPANSVCSLCAPVSHFSNLFNFLIIIIFAWWPVILGVLLQKDYDLWKAQVMVSSF